MIVFSTTLWVTEQGQKKLSDLFWVAWQSNADGSTAVHFLPFKAGLALAGHADPLESPPCTLGHLLFLNLC
jgi:hypothetical protein